MSRRLEPEIKVFSFEKSEKPFCRLAEEEKKEEASNMRKRGEFREKGAFYPGL